MSVILGKACDTNMMMQRKCSIHSLQFVAFYTTVIIFSIPLTINGNWNSL